MFRFRITCADCRLPGFDDTVGCASLDCHGTCIECLRMADGCHCTCRDIGFTVCPTFETITNCACNDGTMETHDILTGAWVGFVISDELKASLLALAARGCPDDPHFLLELYGSVYNFTSHTTTTDLNCPKTTVGWTPIEKAELVPDFQGAALVRGDDMLCTGGAFFLTLADLGIVLNPPPEGAADGTVSCAQEGGSAALMMRIVDPCGNQLLLCPFEGVAGADFQCDFPEECEDWSVVVNTGANCTLDFTFTHISGTCPLALTVTFGSDAPIVIDAGHHIFSKAVPGCITSGDGTPYVVRYQRVWSVDCVHNCAAHNSDVTVTYSP